MSHIDPTNPIIPTFDTAIIPDKRYHRHLGCGPLDQASAYCGCLESTPGEAAPLTADFARG